MNTRELNRITNERHLFLAQLNALLPTVSYLLDRLTKAKVECTPADSRLIKSMSQVLGARTFEEVETIVGKHNDDLINETLDKFFSGNEAVEKLFQDLMDLKEEKKQEEANGDGYGEPGFDDFRDPNTGEDLWPKN